MGMAEPGRHPGALRGVRDPLLTRLLGNLHSPSSADGLDRGVAHLSRVLNTSARPATRPLPALRLYLFRYSPDLPACPLQYLGIKSTSSRGPANYSVHRRLAARLHRTVFVAAR